MKNTILRKFIQMFIRLRNKNPYRREKFPYDMKKAIKYADSIGKRVYQLSEQEMKPFLL